MGDRNQKNEHTKHESKIKIQSKKISKSSNYTAEKQKTKYILINIYVLMLNEQMLHFYSVFRELLVVER